MKDSVPIADVFSNSTIKIDLTIFRRDNFLKTRFSTGTTFSFECMQ